MDQVNQSDQVKTNEVVVQVSEGIEFSEVYGEGVEEVKS